tara:strand:+ start:2408 stop:2956 length:549 start_codon:yes stop_codon:yes gene_type:complete
MKLNNQNTPFTIDMYQTFNGDSSDEQMLEYYNDDNEQKPDSEKNYEYDDFDWVYNTEKIRKDLANTSIEYQKDNILDDIILDINLLSDQSPKYYNYETDSYTASYTIDDIKLLQYININKDDFFKWCKAQSWHIELVTNVIDENMLIYYIEKLEFNSDDYFYDMYDTSSMSWYENTKMTILK